MLHSLSDNVHNATINVFNIQGVLLKTYDNLSAEIGEIIINGDEFNAGMYLYTLIVDGKEIDSKHMILTN